MRDVMGRYRNAEGEFEVYNPEPLYGPQIKLVPHRLGGFYVLVGYIHDGQFYLCDFKVEFTGKRRKVRKKAQQLKKWYADYVIRVYDAEWWPQTKEFQ